MGGGEARDRFEEERMEFFARVRSTYLARARREPGRIKIVDAQHPIKEVQARIASALDGKLKRWK